MSLVHGLESDSIKRDLIEAVYKFLQQIGVGLVAEGVERQEELKVIQSIAIRYAQGHFFAFPDNPLPPVDWLSTGG